MIYYFSFGFNKEDRNTETTTKERATETTLLTTNPAERTEAPFNLPPISTIRPRVPPFRTSAAPQFFDDTTENNERGSVRPPFFSGSTVLPRVPPFRTTPRPSPLRTTPGGEEEGNNQFFY